MTDTQPAPELRLAEFINNLVQIIVSLGAYYTGGLLSNAAARMIIRRIAPIANKVRAIADRVAAGTLRRPPSPRTASTTPARPRPPALRWPHRLRGSHAWLCRIAIQLHPMGNQLDHLLRAPDMQALIQAAPQLRRILRPLCRMLGTTTLNPPKPPPAPRPAPQPRSAAPPVPSLPPRPARPALIPWRMPKLA